MHIVVMSSSNGKDAAPQQPPPGSYPAEPSIAPPPSVVSTSVAVKHQVDEILASANMVAATFKGKPSLVVFKEDWVLVEEKLRSLQQQTGTTVPASELAELQRELSELRLKANAFKDENERIAYSQQALKDSLKIAESKLQAAHSEAEHTTASLEKSQADLKVAMASAQASKKELEKTISTARKSGDAEGLDKLLDEKRRMSQDINSLNSNLQVLNTEKKSVQDRLKRYELQVLELTNELNLEKSRQAIASGKPGTSFAAKAKAMGTESVRLFNVAHTNLSSLAKERFEKVASNPVEDEKNTVFWIKAALDATKHSVYKPYKLVFHGLADDLKIMTHSSRKLFDPFLIAVRDSLLPTGQPLTLDEMSEMLSAIPPESIKLSKEYRDKGFKTLADLPENPESGHFPHASDLPFRNVAGKTTFAKEASKKAKPQPPPSPLKKKQTRKEAEEEALLETDPIPEPDDGESSGDDTPISLWLRMRQWFLVQFDNMNSRVRNSLRKKPSRLARYYKLATGGFFHKICLVPYSWYIWAFP